MISTAILVASIIYAIGCISINPEKSLIFIATWVVTIVLIHNGVFPFITGC